MLVDKQSGEIFLYQPIGADFFGEGITAENFILALDSIGGKRAIVRINSPGGDAFQAISIFNAMKRYQPGVDVVIDSLAASAASIIALGGETRTTAEGASWMIHRAMTFAFGNIEDLQKSMNMLEAGDKNIVAIYQTAMKDKTEKQILDMMSAETWFTPEQSLEIGLSTKIEGKQKGKPSVANWFRNAPQALFNTVDVVKPKVFIHRQAAAIKAKM